MGIKTVILAILGIVSLYFVWKYISGIEPEYHPGGVEIHLGPIEPTPTEVTLGPSDVVIPGDPRAIMGLMPVTEEQEEEKRSSIVGVIKEIGVEDFVKKPVEERVRLLTDTDVITTVSTPVPIIDVTTPSGYAQALVKAQTKAKPKPKIQGIPKTKVKTPTKISTPTVTETIQKTGVKKFVMMSATERMRLLTNR